MDSLFLLLKRSTLVLYLSNFLCSVVSVVVPDGGAAVLDMDPVGNADGTGSACLPDVLLTVPSC